jgi:malate dehydrogenase
VIQAKSGHCKELSVSRNKITVVGAGNVGATTAHIAAAQELADIVLVDIVEGLAEGEALDIAQAGPVQLYDSHIVGMTDWAETADSDIIIVTSGVTRKPGMSRDDLLARNVQIVKEVSEKIVEYSPGSLIIVVCNPLDAMVYTAAKVTGLAKEKIMGMAGALDSARFSCFLARELEVSVEDIKVVLMGGHGDDMVPLPRFSSVSGIPVTELLDEDKIAELIERTRKGGIEVVNLLGTSAYYAPAAGTVKMAEAILKDKKTVMSCCAYCDKEYQVGGYFVGVPAVLGKGGVERVLQLGLNESEQAQFAKSLGHVKQLAAKVDGLL